ncbi:MATE family efflux transporter [Gryllotalpicola protaetiae]|uniref:MATE family efflux transporter n=1 Tax=Gryllotalpicola protaetiae TaxID=2419771 RepID=A0A387BQ34_9MICO|nr:MATE family efflux transporter [Gryllotalpicola protaetiae]AYG04612.1 hypothetical protein D7I44_14495 [Gryllotalpicola protaetiae]
MSTAPVNEQAPERSPITQAFRLAGLAALALLAEPLTGVADAATAGTLGIVIQASLAVGAGIITTTTWLLTPLLFAQTTEIGRLRADGHLSRAGKTVRTTMKLASGWGVILALSITAVALLIIGDPEARSYLLARAAGMPVSALVLAGYGALRGADAVRDVTFAALGGAVVHIGLDALIAATAWGGLLGVGLASGISQLLVFTVVLRRLIVRGLWIIVPINDGTQLIPASTRNFVRPVALLVTRSALLGAATLAMTAAAVSNGPEKAAAHLIVYQCWLLAVLAIEGWKSAAQILISTAPTVTRRRKLERLLLLVSLLIGAVSFLVVLAVGDPVLSGLTADETVSDSARAIWWLSALSLGVGAVAFTRDGIEFGRGAYLFNLSRVAAGSGLGLIGTVVTAASGDLLWMWAAMTAGLVLRAALPSSRTMPSEHRRGLSPAEMRGLSARLPDPISSDRCGTESTR